MKAFNYYKLKSIGRKLSVLGVAALLAVSCGSDKEKNNTAGPVSNVPVGTSPVFGNPSNGGKQYRLSTWDQLKSANNCAQGRMEDMTFTFNNKVQIFQATYKVDKLLEITMVDSLVNLETMTLSMFQRLLMGIQLPITLYYLSVSSLMDTINILDQSWNGQILC